MFVRAALRGRPSAEEFNCRGGHEGPPLQLRQHEYSCSLPSGPILTLIFHLFPKRFFEKYESMGIWLPMPKIRSRLLVACLSLASLLPAFQLNSNAQRSG